MKDSGNNGETTEISCNETVAVINSFAGMDSAGLVVGYTTAAPCDKAAEPGKTRSKFT